MAEQSKEVCEIVQKNLSNDIEKNGKRLDEHDTRLIDMGKLLERVVTLLEVFNKAEDKSKKPSFWETPKGDLLFKALIVLGAAIVIIAFGMNISPMEFVQ